MWFVAIADPVLKYESQILKQSMSQRIPKILILSSDNRRRPSLGGGGNRCGSAEVFDGQSYAVRVVRAVEESTPSQRRWSGSTIGC